jgi:hypothetical protein
MVCGRKRRKKGGDRLIASGIRSVIRGFFQVLSLMSGWLPNFGYGRELWTCILGT